MGLLHATSFTGDRVEGTVMVKTAQSVVEALSHDPSILVIRQLWYEGRLRTEQLSVVERDAVQLLLIREELRKRVVKVA